MKVAKERKSSVLASNAVHHRIDSLTSIVALIAIAGSHFFTGTTWLDPVGGLIVSTMVIKAGWANTGRALLELADVGIDGEMKKSVRKAAGAAIQQKASDVANAKVLDVQGVKAGQNYLVDVELSVPSAWTVRQTRDIEEVVRESVGAKVRGVRRVKVRFVPEDKASPDFKDEFIPADVSPRASPEPTSDNSSSDNDHDQLPANGDARKRQ